MEAFAIATRRCFDDDHPLSYLLRAHSRFMIANNRVGRDLLIAPDGTVDRLLAGEIGESVEMARLAALNTHFINDNFVNDIKKRNVTKDRLPYYPYRDDGQLLWDAIWNFTSEYVSVTYSSDAAIQEDKELQLWCQELADPKQGAVNGMKSKVSTAEELVEILTSMIFISGPGHSAGEICAQNRCSVKAMGLKMHECHACRAVPRGSCVFEALAPGGTCVSHAVWVVAHPVRIPILLSVVLRCAVLCCAVLCCNVCFE